MQTYIGRCSFGVVRVQIYRGIKVAVKELLPRSLASDVRHEAGILAMFCHPYLPLLFGIHTATQPYKIVMHYIVCIKRENQQPCMMFLVRAKFVVSIQ